MARGQCARYRDGLDAVLADAQQSGEYLGGFHVRDSENGHSLHICDADSDEKRKDYIPSSVADDDVEVVPPPTEPL